jgi:hypothetical protein
MDRPAEDDDSDAEMADYRADFSDDVDPNFDHATACPQLGSTIEIRPRRSFAGASREVPFKLRLNLTLALINSPSCRLQYGRLPYVALAFLGRQASNAASEGCHSTGQLVMSDKQTTMSNDTLEKTVCLRNSRMAVTVLKKIYVDEAKHVALDISVRLGQVYLRLPPQLLSFSTSASNLAESREADDSSMFRRSLCLGP